ncbi:hypothetical protein QN362_11355 [Actimicrobium sp. CCC2.4]|uniref:hypothetical protein n=1 Tax=Actimicrobium sp. CCC2.4 TaxID=3048606 RepID=UPI002AC98639|nr:hypothetical protein [Actimicrobium sp. CCC2.4]MEB0135925.1 hypothetical protein [Actimicrobium sp. CCC2.4]WPX32591.1 hypothetical protein RHM62_01715 [Actimicrobium sp. CCC2.4]
MSILAIAFPAQSAIPVAQAVISSIIVAARPLLGIGAVLTLFLIFKPLLLGLARASLVALKPRKSLEQRSIRSHLRGMLILNRMAQDLDISQPNMASELRAVASRD